MALGVETPIRILTGTGSATDFDYAPIFSLSNVAHLSVFIDGVATTDFTHITGGIRFSSAPLTGVEVKLIRTTPLDQPTPSAGLRTFDLQVVEASLDRTTRQTQEINEILSRAPKAAPGATPPGGSFLRVINSTVGQDASGNIISRTVAQELAHLGVTAALTAANSASSNATTKAAEANTSANEAEASATTAAAASAEIIANTAQALAPNSPLQRTAVPENEDDGNITGTLTPDATGTFTRLGDIELADGIFAPYFSSDPANGFPATRIYHTGGYNQPAAPWLMQTSTGGSFIPFASWASTSVSLDDAPHPGLATGWAPSVAVGLPAATGTPTVTYVPPTTGWTANVTIAAVKNHWINLGTLAVPDWQKITNNT